MLTVFLAISGSACFWFLVLVLDQQDKPWEQGQSGQSDVVDLMEAAQSDKDLLRALARSSSTSGPPAPATIADYVELPANVGGTSYGLWARFPNPDLDSQPTPNSRSQACLSGFWSAIHTA